MIKQILFSITLTATSIFSHAQDMVLDNNPKTKTNAEIVQEMRDMISAVNRIDKMFEGFAITKGETITKEKIVKPFTLDTSIALTQLQEAAIADLKLYQVPQAKGSSVTIDKHYSTLQTTGETYELRLIPKKIYFYDGTSSTDHLENLEMDFHFGSDWPFKKRIDSIACDMELTYFNKMDNVVLNSLHPKASYNGLPLELKKTDKNMIAFTYDNTIDVFKCEPLNVTGKTLYDKASNTLSYNDDDKNFLPKFKNSITALLKEAEKDTALSSEKFQAIYIAKLDSLEDGINGEHKLTYKKMLCEGTVKGVRINIAKDRKSITQIRTIAAAAWDDIHMEANDTISKFYDNNGDVIFTTPISLTAINGWFYEDNDKTFYYFSPTSKHLEKLAYYDISNLSGGYVKALKDENGDDILLDKNNKSIGNFEKILSNDQVITCYKQNDVLLITPGGKQKWLKGLQTLTDFNNGYAVIEIKDKYGFIDREGNEAIPVMYDDVQSFGSMTSYTTVDNLFGVKKNGKWGFVDAYNKEVIPFIYDEVEPFSYGVTMVKKGENRGLINIKNKIIAPFEGGSSYALSTNFGKRMYSLGSGNYDHLGKKQAKEK